MSFDEWQKWLFDMPGFYELINFNPHEQIYEEGI